MSLTFVRSTCIDILSLQQLLLNFTFTNYRTYFLSVVNFVCLCLKIHYRSDLRRALLLFFS